MPYVKGFLNIVSGDSPDNELPAMPPGIDNSLPSLGVGIDNTLPSPPPGVWPPPTVSHPIVPIPPNTTLPIKPGTIWPSPGVPSHPIHTPPNYPSQGLPPTPDQGLPPASGGKPDQGLPKPPPVVDNTLPSQTFWVVAGIPGIGWRYVAVDPSLTIGYPMPPPPTAQPK